MPEALEKWPVHLFERSAAAPHGDHLRDQPPLPGEVSARFPQRLRRLGRMSLIEDGHERQVRMAHLAVVGSFSVNGVAELHSELLKERVFRDFYDLWPEQVQQQDQRRHPAPLHPPVEPAPVGAGHGAASATAGCATSTNSPSWSRMADDATNSAPSGGR
jgi:hypothetical protein